jgi:hypothetical protein
LILLALSLAACNRGTRSSEAVRQGVIDHLAKGGFNVSAMDVNLTTVDMKGNEAVATVSITPKGGPAGSGMVTKYRLQQQGNQWTVVGREDAGGAPHGAGAPLPGSEAPPAASPGGASPHGGSGAMPSPADLPPVKKK